LTIFLMVAKSSTTKTFIVYLHIDYVLV